MAFIPAASGLEYRRECNCPALSTSRRPFAAIRRRPSCCFWVHQRHCKRDQGLRGWASVTDDAVGRGSLTCQKSQRIGRASFHICIHPLMTSFSDSASIGGTAPFTLLLHPLTYLPAVQSYISSLQTLSERGLLFQASPDSKRRIRPHSLNYYIVSYYQAVLGETVSCNSVKVQLKRLRKQSMMPGERLPPKHTSWLM